MSDYLEKARQRARVRLDAIIADLDSSDKSFGEKACVYATGSFGRLEASALSDLDLFIITDVKRDGDKEPKPLLDGIDEIRLQYDLIRVAEKNEVAKFDGGGRFLAAHTIESYTKWLGSREDDYRNTLTGRMLLILESRPLIGGALYQKALDEAISVYFRDYSTNAERFVPSFLLNDVMRMWRTFCVNYEFYRKVGDSRNKIKNLKLKFSRMLTCYSGVLHMLATYAKQSTVRPADVQKMVTLSPTERLAEIATDRFWDGAPPDPALQEAVAEALAGYSEFLELTHQDTKKAVRQYRAHEDAWRVRSYSFGERLSIIIDLLGQRSPEAARLRRLIMV